MARILIAGCGYVGVALGLRLSAQGHQVFALRRNAAALPPPLVPISADLTQLRSLTGLPEGLDGVVYCAASDSRTPTDYHRAYVQGPRNLMSALERRGDRPKRLIFVSSTSVYGHQHGEWVDETSETEPWHFSGRLLLEAEIACREFLTPAVVVRFSGIYGPGRQRWIDRIRSGAPLSPLAGERYTNRIHHADCIGVLEHLLGHANPDGLYLASDQEPATALEVAAWTAQRLGLPAPRLAFAALSQDADHSNKRCRNKRLLASGYRFLFPTYREGLAASLAPSAVC